MVALLFIDDMWIFLAIRGQELKMSHGIQYLLYETQYIWTTYLGKVIKFFGILGGILYLPNLYFDFLNKYKNQNRIIIHEAIFKGDGVLLKLENLSSNDDSIKPTIFIEGIGPHRIVRQNLIVPQNTNRKLPSCQEITIEAKCESTLLAFLYITLTIQPTKAKAKKIRFIKRDEIFNGYYIYFIIRRFLFRYGLIKS